jgi:hypothetical protein
MLDTLEEAVAARIKDKLADAAGRIEVQRGIGGIPVQAVYVSMEEGKFQRVTSNTFSCDVTGFVDIVFSNLQNEEQRRKGIFPILEGIIQCLLSQTLALKIDPIMPKSFINTTTEEQKKAGLIVFTLQISTKYYITKLNEDEITDLLKIGLNYYLQDPVDDNIADASDLVTLDQI